MYKRTVAIEPAKLDELMSHALEGEVTIRKAKTQKAPVGLVDYVIEGPHSGRFVRYVDRVAALFDAEKDE